MRIHNSVILITGASSGLGATMARELAARGAKVVLGARRTSELDALAAEIRDAGGHALAVQADVTRREDIDQLVQEAIDGYGRIDVLINNAGISGGASVQTSTDEEMQRIINVNLLAPARCVQAVLPHMRKQGGGVIINIGSVSGEIAVQGLYSATKFGIRGFSDALRRELRGDNIAVVLIAPGFIRTTMTADLKLPMPGPEAVAKVVIKSIERPRRKIIVPWPYIPLAWAGKLLPGITDMIIGSGRYQQHNRKRTGTR